MTHDKDEWADLQRAWQSRGNLQTSGEAHRKTVEREKRRLLVEATVEAVAWIICIVTFVVFSIHASGAIRYVLIGLAFLSIAAMMATALMRRSLWRAQTETHAAYRTFLRRRARQGLWFGRLGYIGGPPGLVVGLLVGRAFRPEAVPVVSNPWLILAVLCFLAACWWAMREARKWRRILDQLGPDDTNAAD